MDIVTHMLHVIVALRWLLAVVAFALLGLLYADALAELKKKRERIQSLEAGNRRLVAQLAHRRQRPIIASRVIR